jgi:peptide deformylase
MFQLRTYPDPVLKEISKPVNEINQEVKTLVEEMMETMNAHQGVGLAAPQVGRLQRVVVIGIPEEEPFSIINPEITKPSGEELLEEGCLSIPGVQVPVNRPVKVFVTGLSPDGEKIKIQAENLLARVVQHEVDHLNGILIIDKLSKKERLEFELNYIRNLSQEKLLPPTLKI